MSDTNVNLNEIVREIEIAAPIERVWNALTDSRKFGAWFMAELDGPFVAGERTTGRITHPQFDGVPFACTVTALDARQRFAFTWHPYAVEPDYDYESEPPTLVEFTLTALGERTRVTVRESGFERLPPHRMPTAIRMNGDGWTHQLQNLAAYLADE